MNETLIGIANRDIAGSDISTKQGARIPAGSSVRVRETRSGQWVVSARGIRTLPMTFAQLIARVGVE